MNNEIDAVLFFYKWRIMKRFNSMFAYDVSDTDRELFLDALTEIENDIRELISLSPREQAKVIEQLSTRVEFQNNNLN